jgi:hypothetical protein
MHVDDRIPRPALIPSPHTAIWIDDETGQVVEIVSTGRCRARGHLEGELSGQTRQELVTPLPGQQLVLDFITRQYLAPPDHRGCRPPAACGVRRLLPRGGAP